ncbi:MAG: hypothetical protein AB7V16_07155 [Vulcanibacillus sp.]
MQITEKEMRNRLKLDTKNDLIDKLIMAYMTIRQSQEKREQAIATARAEALREAESKYKADADRLAEFIKIEADALEEAGYSADADRFRSALAEHEDLGGTV